LEAFLDRTSAVHWVLVAVLLVSGALTAFIGVRDGFVRRIVRTNSAVFVGWKAVVAGAVYVAFGLGGVIGAALFTLRGH